MAKKNNENSNEVQPSEGTKLTSQSNEIVNHNIIDDEVVSYKLKIRKATPNFNSSQIPVVKKTCTLVSRLNNPVYISYGSSSLLIPPRGKVSDLNPEMLGSLPKGIDSLLK